MNYGCASGMAGTVPGGLGALGADPFSSLLSFIPDTLKAAGGIAGSVPALMAAFGDENAKAYVAQQGSLECTRAGGIWTGTSCDMSIIAAQREAEAQRRAVIDRVKAYGPWVAMGLGVLGLTYATVQAFKPKQTSKQTSGRAA